MTPLRDEHSADDRSILGHYLSRAATYHERKRTKVLIAGTAMQRLLALCGDRVPKRAAKVYSLTPAEARVYALRLRETAREGAA